MVFALLIEPRMIIFLFPKVIKKELLKKINKYLLNSKILSNFAVQKLNEL